MSAGAAMGLDRDAIAARIPHAGRMVLIDRAITWDAKSIQCATLTHRDPSNPMREASGLPAWAAIEYGAQAAALHGSLVSSAGKPRRGVLAALRNVQAHCERLDAIAGELTVCAMLIHADPAGAIYRFEVKDGATVLASGRATLMYVKDPEPA